MKKLQYIIWCSLLLFVASCEKDTEPTSFAPVPVTGETSGITRFEATLSGTVTRIPIRPRDKSITFTFLCPPCPPNYWKESTLLPVLKKRKMNIR